MFNVINSLSCFAQQSKLFFPFLRAILENLEDLVNVVFLALR